LEKSDFLSTGDTYMKKNIYLLCKVKRKQIKHDIPQFTLGACIGVWNPIIHHPQITNFLQTPIEAVTVHAVSTVLKEQFPPF